MTGVTGGTNNVAGYGTAVVTGATVTAVHYNVDTLDQSKVDSIVFTATGDLSAKTMQLGLTNGGADVAAPNTCTPVYTLSTAITCVFVTPVAISSFDGEKLTVSQ
jgi:hypothetical protein